MVGIEPSVTVIFLFLTMLGFDTPVERSCRPGGLLLLPRSWDASPMRFGEHAMSRFTVRTTWAPKALVGAVSCGGPGTSYRLVIRRKGTAPRM